MSTASPLERVRDIAVPHQAMAWKGLPSLPSSGATWRVTICRSLNASQMEISSARVSWETLNHAKAGVSVGGRVGHQEPTLCDTLEVAPEEVGYSSSCREICSMPTVRNTASGLLNPGTGRRGLPGLFRGCQNSGKSGRRSICIRFELFIHDPTRCQGP